MKICTKCKKEKKESEFHVNKCLKSGLRSACKECVKKYQNSASRKSYMKKYTLKYATTGRKTEKYKSWRRRYERVYTKSEKFKEYRRSRKANDPLYKLAVTLRVRLYLALKNNQRTGSAIRDLGCSVKELKAHIERQFREGMSWDNWKHDGWHIDHIIPLSSFDLTNREELLKAVNYSNLQPLWAEENFEKSNKVMPLQTNA